MTILPLITRLEAASGPDRELDARLYCFEHGHDYNESEKRAHTMWVKGVGWPVQCVAAPKYTSSLDAAIALVERMLPDSWEEIVREAFYAWIDRTSSNENARFELVRALISAMLGAMIEREEQNLLDNSG